MNRAGGFLSDRLLEESLVRYRELSDQRGAAACLYQLADLARAADEPERVQSLGAASLALYRTAGDLPGIADVLLFCLTSEADAPATEGHYREALALSRASEYPAGIAMATYRLAGIAEGRGDLARAMDLYEESLALFSELGDQRRIANVTEILGEIAVAQGDATRARTCFEKSLAIYQRLGASTGLLSVFYNFAGLAKGTGQWASMEEYAARGLKEAQAAENANGIRDGLALLAEARGHLGASDLQRGRDN